MKKNIGIFTGGYSEEKVIAEKSADFIEANLPKEKYKLFRIQVEREQWKLKDGIFNREKGVIESHTSEIKLDAAYIIIHGPPAEDGLLQAYLEMMKIPYTFSATLSCSITFDKNYAKQIAQHHKIPVKPSILLRKGASIQNADRRLGLPFFVKPNKHGSSFGISKVESKEQIETAIDFAFQYDDEILLEAFADGIELSCGVIEHQGELIPLPITEIRPKSAFFDYAAKYEEASEEITPAEISKDLQKHCQDLSLQLFKAFKCSGLARFDYILEDGTCYFIEANTIPGLSPNSIIPQQLEAHGISSMSFVEEQLLRIL